MLKTYRKKEKNRLTRFVWVILLVVGFSSGCRAQDKRYHGDGIDDYLQYVPMASSFILKMAGVPSRSSWEGRLYKSGATFLLTAGTTYALKHAIHSRRPDGTDNHSFPSGHTAVAFCGATVLHKEYGKVSPWISVAGYTVATVTAVDRVRRNRHRWGDVAAGAAIGYLSAEASYWIVEKLMSKKKKTDPSSTDDGQKVMVGVSADGLAMVIKL